MSLRRDARPYSDPIGLLGAALGAAFNDEFIDVRSSNLAESLRVRRGAFVTLTRGGTIRGSMGTFWPLHGNAGREIVWSGLQAAFNDVRFPPLDVAELDDIYAVVDLIDSPKAVSVDELDEESAALVEADGLSLMMLPFDDSISWESVIALDGPGAAAESAAANILAGIDQPISRSDLLAGLFESINPKSAPAVWRADVERFTGPLSAALTSR